MQTSGRRSSGTPPAAPGTIPARKSAPAAPRSSSPRHPPWRPPRPQSRHSAVRDDVHRSPRSLLSCVFASCQSPPSTTAAAAATPAKNKARHARRSARAPLVHQRLALRVERPLALQLRESRRHLHHRERPLRRIQRQAAVDPFAESRLQLVLRFVRPSSPPAGFRDCARFSQDPPGSPPAGSRPPAEPRN